MRTVGLHTTVQAGQAFELTKLGLVEVDHDNPRNLGDFHVASTPPKYVDVHAFWTHRPLSEGEDGANALGMVFKATVN